MQIWSLTECFVVWLEATNQSAKGEHHYINGSVTSCRPALEFPGVEKQELLELCWSMFSQAHPGAQRDTQSNDALKEFSMTIQAIKRREYFGQVAVRQQLRDSALVAIERLELFFGPKKTIMKRANKIRARIEALLLPPRSATAPHPVVLLMQQALHMGLINGPLC